jgi:hypothetical protein
MLCTYTARANPVQHEYILGTYVYRHTVYMSVRNNEFCTFSVLFNFDYGKYVLT